MSYNRVSAFNRFSLLFLVSVGLMIIDHRSNLLQPVRTVTPVINIVFESLVSLPQELILLFERYYPDDALHSELTELRQKQRILESKLQKYESLELENKRLMQLFQASKQSSDEVLLTKIIETGLEPFSQKVIVDKGLESGVYMGQPAIAAEGVLGQVSKTGYKRSVITLITDPAHGLPVQVERNGLRTIVHGAGKPGWLNAPYLENQSDVQLGDLLVTSGIGGRFPAGYKVAVVDNIVKDANEAFLNVTAATTAKIDYVKELLLLWNSDRIGGSGSSHSESALDSGYE